VRFLTGVVAFFFATLVIGGRAEDHSARLPRFEKVYLVFAEEHSLEFVSGFGHAFLCFAPASAATADDLLLCPSVNFGVDLTPAGGGLFSGTYSLQPSFELVRQNSFFQQRRLYFFELHIDASERERLREELTKRLGRTYPYDFLRRNCGFYLAEALLVARPDAPLRVKGPYLTPRQATAMIVRAFGSHGGLVVASPGLLADQALQAEPNADRRAALVAAAGSLPAVVRCEDPELKLLYLRMWEARASAEEYPKVLAAKEAHLATQAGKEAARNVNRAESLPFSDLQQVWPTDEEGPDVGVGVFAGTNAGSPAGLTVRADLGLRGRQTTPRPRHLLRDVRFLGLDLDWADGKCRSEFTLAEISTVSDFCGLMGAGSSGARFFFNERLERMDTRGLGFDVWSGLAARADSVGWIGAKMHFVVDHLEGPGRAQLAPELFFFKEAAGLTWEGSLLLARGSQMNWFVGGRFHLPEGCLSGALSIRYESLPVVGGRLHLDWRRRF
jgi:hypothetical protein